MRISPSFGEVLQLVKALAKTRFRVWLWGLGFYMDSTSAGLCRMLATENSDHV